MLIFFSLFLIIHYIFVSDSKIKELPKITLYIVAACYLLCLAYYFYDFLLNNKVKIIFLFYFFFLFSLGSSIIVDLPVTEQFSCGAFKYLNLLKPIKEIYLCFI
jgi:hypothetical protein